MKRRLRNALPAAVQGPASVPDEIQQRLSPQVRELIAPAHYTHVKDIVKQDVVRLT